MNQINNPTMDNYIKDIVHKIETRFEEINIEVYYFDETDIHYILIPKKYFEDQTFQKLVFEIDEEAFISDVTNYYFVDKLIDKDIELMYSTPQLEFA